MPGPMTQASRLKKDSGLVQHLIKAVPARTAELAGIKILNLLYTANINMTHVFKHPKFYRIPRDKSDQVISKSSHDGESERAPGPGHKLPDSTMVKQRASSSTSRDQEPQAASIKLQAPSVKRQAFEPTCSSAKRQASQPE